jgi:hypothetical protein
MNRIVARLNIEHSRHALETETDQTKRQTLLRLLAEEEARLEAMLKAATKPRSRRWNESRVALGPNSPLCRIEIDPLLRAS